MRNRINFDKVYYYLILLLAFTLPISRAVISIISVLLPVIWIIEGNFKYKFQIIKNNKALLFFTLFIAFSLLSLLWTQNFIDAKRPVRLFVYYLDLIVIATSFNPKYTYRIINAFLVGIFISVFIAYGVAFELWQFKYASPNDPSPFMLHLEYSIFLAFASILLLNRVISKKYTTKEKIIYGLFFIAVVGNLFLTQGRTGQVAFIIALLILPMMHFKISIKSFIISSAIIASIIAITYNVDKTFNARVSYTINSISEVSNNHFNNALSMRLAYYVVTPGILKEHLLAGVGIGDYQDAIRQEIDKKQYSYFSKRVREFVKKYNPHSQYVVIVLQTGLIGLILFILFLYQFTKSAINEISDNEIKEVSILFMIIFTASFFADSFLLSQFSLALFMVFSGLFMTNVKKS